jgi:hypothetical protein
MTFNRGTVNDLHIPVSLSQNSLTIHSSVTLPFFGGIISVSDLSGKSIVSSDRKFHFGLQARDIDLASLTHSAGDIPCRLQAEFTEVRYEGGIWTATGKVSAQIFGGVVEAANLHGKDIFVSSRRVGADIHFRDIDLEGLSSALKFGKMTGSLEGQMRNFEMEYGQPARFVLDVDSVERKGVDKKISVDAVENITILGTGSEGMESILKSGINRFFKEYPYSRLGIRCTLENDVFTVRGKIVEDGVEYLIRKGFLRGIDVVNMNPNNTISFKDMQERVNRISNKQEAYQQ